MNQKERPCNDVQRYLWLIPLLVYMTSCTPSIEKKFKDIDIQLMQSLDSIQGSNATLRKQLQADAIATRKAQVVHQLTENIISYLQGFRQGLASFCKDEQGKVNLLEEQKVQLYALGTNKDGKAYELERELDRYIRNMNALDPRFDFESMTQIPLSQGNQTSELTQRDFAAFHFNYTPLVAAMPTLAEFMRSALITESEALKVLGAKP